MKSLNKALLSIFGIFLFGCASTKVVAPVDSFATLTSSHKITACATEKTKNDPGFQKSGVPVCFELNSKSAASASVIRHYKEPENKQDRSLVLTVAHWCAPDLNEMLPPGGPREMIAAKFFEISNHEIYNNYVFDNNRNQYKILKYISVDQEKDVCLLEVERMNVKPARLMKQNLNYGDRVINIAAPWGLINPPYPYMSEGIYLGECVNRGICRILGEFNVSGIYAGKGSSGSPIYVKRFGVWMVGGIIHTVRVAPYGGTYVPMGATAEQINEVINRDFTPYLKNQKQTKPKESNVK